MHDEALDAQKRLRSMIGEILWFEWDPIGVSSEPTARSEYASYVPQVFTLALDSNDPEPIAKHLDGITQSMMGLDINHEHTLAIGSKVLALKARLGL